MKRFHLVFGLLLVVIFLLTGQYMRIHLHRLQYLPDGPRMLFRSRHIYILLAGLLNLGLGIYYTYRMCGWRRSLQFAGSILIILSPLAFIVAFFYEPRLADLDAPLTGWGMYGIVAGTLFHLFSSLGTTQHLPS
jgi:hypothetical protein